MPSPTTAQSLGALLKSTIEPPYRWRDWAAQSDGITGDELLAFISQEECTLPNSLRRATKGAGLFRYLRMLASSDVPNPLATLGQ